MEMLTSYQIVVCFVKLNKTANIVKAVCKQTMYASIEKTTICIVTKEFSLKGPLLCIRYVKPT